MFFLHCSGSIQKCILFRGVGDNDRCLSIFFLLHKDMTVELEGRRGWQMFVYIVPAA
jgi:hypothetical protein